MANSNSIKYTAKLLNVVFRTTNGAFTVSRLSSIQVLQYGTTCHPDCLVEARQLCPQTHVNILLHCISDNSQAQKCFTIRGNRFKSTGLDQMRSTNQALTSKPRHECLGDGKTEICCS